MNILKFGGTSVGSANAIKLLANIVSKQHNPIVICSAMSGVTDALLQMATLAADGKDFTIIFVQLEQKHIELIKQLLPIDKQNEIFIAVKLYLNHLEELLFSIKNIRELSVKTQAMILGFGEQLSCTIIAAFINAVIKKAVFVNATSLIITDSIYNNATVNKPVTYHNIKSWHANLQNEIPVITGFIAANEAGHITNLGRGGSDYTASILGAALDAAEIQIWTDVDGFYTADPRLVKNAFPQNMLSYQEAMELSYFGAKVIYPPTMLPAIEKNIPIIIKNTFNENASGTYITAQTALDDAPIKGIASIADISLVNIEGSAMIGFKGFSGRLFSALALAGVNIIFITQASSEHSISIGITPQDASIAMAAITNNFEYEISTNGIEVPTCQHNLSILAVVGRNMKNAKGLSGALFSALAKCGINIVAIAQGSSELNISIVIEKQDLKKALNAAHDDLFLSPMKTLHLFITGLGNIGSELLSQIQKATLRLQTHHHLLLKIMGICNSTQMLLNADDGIDVENWQQQLLEQGEAYSSQQFLSAIEFMNLPNSIFIDNTSNEAVANSYLQLFNKNIAVVTCNKIANAEPYHKYKLLHQTRKKNNVDFNYETNVGAGLPIIKTLQELLISGDDVIEIQAILSGTISYIFNNFKGDATFATIVKNAQELGYTEPDPRDDLSGADFIKKVVIIAREMGMQLEKEDVQLGAILPIECMKANSVIDFYTSLQANNDMFENLKKQATAEQKVIRYIATINKNGVKIELKMVDQTHPFYSLSGSDNIISFTTERYKNNPLVIKGPGAGAAVTAAGVFADIVKVSTK